MTQNWKTCGRHASVTRRHFLFGAATAGLLRVRADAATATIRKIFTEEPSVFDPREYLGPVRDAIYQVVKARMEAFGSAGHNDDYAPATLEDAKRAYTK